jgi:hypothetical protein
MFGVEFAFGLTITALMLLVGHWFPWPKRLHRLAAYAYGVGAILFGTAIWLGLQGLWTTWLGIVAFAVVGGLTTGMAWGIDGLLNLWLRVRHHERNG